MPPLKAVINKWVVSVQKSLKEWLDLAYNVHTASKEYWTYDEILMTPIKDVLRWVDQLTPRLREIQKRQATKKLQDELLTPQQRRQALLNRINKER